MVPSQIGSMNVFSIKRHESFNFLSKGSSYFETSLLLIYSLPALSLCELLSLSQAVLSQSPLTQNIQSLEWFCVSL